MNQRAVATIIVCVLLVSAVILGIMIQFPPFEDNRRLLPELDPLPSSEITPGDSVDPIIIDNLTFQARVQFHIFMPHNGYNTFRFILDLNVTNNGPYVIDNLNATKASVFFENSTHLYTFGLISLLNYTLDPDRSRVFTYGEDRDMPIVLGKLGFETLYMRVHITFGTGSEVIVTTPLSTIMVAME